MSVELRARSAGIVQRIEESGNVVVSSQSSSVLPQAHLMLQRLLRLRFNSPNQFLARWDIVNYPYAYASGPDLQQVSLLALSRKIAPAQLTPYSGSPFKNTCRPRCPLT